MYSDLHGAGADDLHGLPIRRFLPSLDEVELKPCIPAGLRREVPNIVLAGAHELDDLHNPQNISSWISYQGARDNLSKEANARGQRPAVWARLLPTAKGVNT